MRMSVGVTSGLQGSQASVQPDPGGWHCGVKSGGRDGEEGALQWGYHGLNKETL